MFEFKDEPQSLSDLFNGGLNLYSISFKETWYLTMVIVLVTSIIPGLSFNYSGEVLVIPAYMWFYIFYGLFSAGISLFCAGLLMQRMFVIGSKTKEKMTASIKHVTEHFLKIAISLSLISFLTYAGFVFLILPGLFIGVLFVYVFPLLLLDDYSIKDAFKGSAYLVFDNWYRIFAIMAAPIALVCVATLLVGGNRGFWVQIIQAIVMWFSIPLLYAMILASFYDSKLRHHMPLHLRIQSVKSKSKPKPTRKIKRAKA